MTTPGHRQFNPLFILQRSASYLSEAVATLSRRLPAVLATWGAGVCLWACGPVGGYMPGPACWGVPACHCYHIPAISAGLELHGHEGLSDDASP